MKSTKTTRNQVKQNKTKQKPHPTRIPTPHKHTLNKQTPKQTNKNGFKNL